MHIQYIMCISSKTIHYFGLNISRVENSMEKLLALVKTSALTSKFIKEFVERFCTQFVRHLFYDPNKKYVEARLFIFLRFQSF